MATVTKGKTFISGETVEPADLHQLVDSATVTAIQTADISDSQITTAKIADSAVTNAKIADSAVTNAKIASGVDASKLTTGTLPADRIGSSAITTARINDAAVTAAKLAPKVTFPDYGAGAARNYNQTYQAAEDGYLLIVVSGSFRNYAQMVVGATNSPATVVWQNGDDINVNTKWASALIPVPKDIYYKVQPGSFPGSPEGFESVVLTWFPVSA